MDGSRNVEVKSYTSNDLKSIKLIHSARARVESRASGAERKFENNPKKTWLRSD